MQLSSVSGERLDDATESRVVAEVAREITALTCGATEREVDGEHHRCEACSYNAEHGSEAEELRSGVERIIESDSSLVGGHLINLLDRVDARDSLAHLREVDARQLAAAPASAVRSIGPIVVGRQLAREQLLTELVEARHRLRHAANRFRCREGAEALEPAAAAEEIELYDAARGMVRAEAEVDLVADVADDIEGPGDVLAAAGASS